MITARSSTSVSVIMTRPGSLESSPRSMSSRIITIVLATQTMLPTAIPCRSGQPISMPAAAPRAMERRMPRGAPARATHFTQKIGNGEFNADGKHEQDDADFGHGFKRVNVVDTQTGSEGAEN